MESNSSRQDALHLVGRHLLELETGELHRIDRILPPLEHCENMGAGMSLTDLVAGDDNAAHWVSEIGEDYFLVDQGCPEHLLDTLIIACRRARQAENIKLTAFQDISCR